VTDTPVLDDCPLDAKNKSAISGLVPKIARGWPFHEDDCLRLLDLAFAWQTELPGRAFTFLSPSSHDCPGSFKTSLVHAYANPRASIQQFCVGPITAPVNPRADFLPFALSGCVDAIRNVGPTLTEPRYKYTHTALSSGRNSFALVRVGTSRRDHVCSISAKCVASVKDLADDSEEFLGGSLGGQLPLSANALGVIAAGERAKQNRIATTERLASQRKIREENTRSEKEIKEAYPNLGFPEEVGPALVTREEGREEEGQGESKQQQRSKKDPEIAKRQRPKRQTMVEAMDTLEFKWLDFDVQAYGGRVKERLHEFSRLVLGSDDSEYRNAVEGSYRQFFDANEEGVILSDIAKLVCDLFVKSAPLEIQKLCLPTTRQQDRPANAAHFIEIATWAVMKRRYDAMENRTLAAKPLPFAEVINICNTVGACAIMARQALDLDM
jgi:hypothetical protein